MAEQNTPPAAGAENPPADAQSASMDPDTAADILSVVFSRAVQDGMDPGFKSITFMVGDNGDVSVQSESTAGSKFEGVMAAGDIAADLGMEPADAEDSAPAQ